MTIEMSLRIVLNDYLGTCFGVINVHEHEESRSRSSVIVHPHKQEEQVSQSHKKFCQITGILMALTHSHHVTATAILLQRRCAQVYKGRPLL